MLFGCYILRALTAPEAYGLHLSRHVAIGHSGRRNLAAISLAIERLIDRSTLGDIGPKSAETADATRYLTPQLLATGPATLAAAASALCAREPRRSHARTRPPWPPPVSDDGGDDGGDGGSCSVESPPVETVVIEESCLIALLRFVRRNLPDEITLPSPLALMCGLPPADTDEGGTGTAAAPLELGTRCWYVIEGVRHVARVVSVQDDGEVRWRLRRDAISARSRRDLGAISARSRRDLAPPSISTLALA